MFAVPHHHPAHHARITYVWGDEHWHLLDTPPTVVLISATVSQGDPHDSPAAAEQAFWRGIVNSILSSDTDRIASARWPAAELVVIRDSAGQLHLAEHAHQRYRARTYTSEIEALTAWWARLRDLMPGARL